MAFTRVRKTVALVVAALVVAAVTVVVVATMGAVQRRGLAVQITALEEQLALIYRGAYSSGGGVNMKMMPDPDTGQATVPLPEVFSFDRNHAFCRVDTNRERFAMPTHQMGEVVIEPGKFFMAMEATTIDQYEVATGADGRTRVTMTGGMDCATEVGLATMTIGSRTAAEHATYRIEAVDGGRGGGASGDSFAFTVFFDPQEAPINFGIFGPEFTFTGEMVSGEVTIVDPKATAAAN